MAASGPPPTSPLPRMRSTFPNTAVRPRRPSPCRTRPNPRGCRLQRRRSPGAVRRAVACVAGRRDRVLRPDELRRSLYRRPIDTVAEDNCRPAARAEIGELARCQRARRKRRTARRRRGRPRPRRSRPKRGRAVRADRGDHGEGVPWRPDRGRGRDRCAYLPPVGAVPGPGARDRPRPTRLGSSP